MGNQLIIIGNGFDLECGLKSTYGAFFKYLADRSSTTKNDQGNIWNHIFKFLHDANSLVRFFHKQKFLLKNAEKIRYRSGKTGTVLVQEKFDEWVRENFDGQAQKDFAKRGEGILDA